MKSTFDKLDCDSPDEIAHPVAFALTRHNFDQAFDGFLLTFFRDWFDALPDRKQRFEFERWLNSLCETTDLGGDESIRHLLHGFVLPLLQDWHLHFPGVLEHFPAKELAGWQDVETPEVSCQRFSDAFLNDYFIQRSMDRSWLADYCSLHLKQPLPVFEKLKLAAMASQLSADSEEDLELCSDLAYSMHDPDSESESFDAFLLGLYDALLRAYLPAFEKLPLNEQLAVIAAWSRRQRLSFNDKPAHSILIQQLVHSDQLPDELEREDLLVLMYVIDSNREWMRLPECVRMELYERLRNYDLPLSDSTHAAMVFVPDTEKHDPTTSPRFWLQRPDSALYSPSVLEWLLDLPEVEKVEALEKLFIDLPVYSEQTQVQLKEVLSSLAAQLMKIPLDAAYQLLLSSSFYGQLDEQGLTEVYLGRMRQYAKSGEVDFQKYFASAYDRVLSKDPMKALSRLLDALIVTANPVCDENLAFCDDLSRYFTFPTVTWGYENDRDALVGGWLMRRLYDWVFRYLTEGAWGRVEFGLGAANLRLNKTGGAVKIREFWAEYCWRKLDLKKTAKRKDPLELTADDYLEPRPAWRIAHLKSLGDLGEDLGNKAHRRIHAISKHDPDEEVRAVAKEVYHKTLRERMKSAGNPFYSFIKVTMWFRVANRKSLGLDVDGDAAVNQRNRELRLANAVYEQYMAS